jgi:hypothetical protein
VRRVASDTSGTLGGLFNVGTATNLGTVGVTPMNGESLHVDCTLSQNGRGLTSVHWFTP